MARILLCAAEAAPHAVVGGVAEYVLGLSRALVAKGHDVRVVIPAYGFIDAQRMPQLIPVAMGAGASFVAPLLKAPSRDGSQELHLIDAHPFYSQCASALNIYIFPGAEPWVAFSSAVARLADKGFYDGWRPEVVHANDSQTSCVPFFLRERVPTVYTIHNLLDKGSASKDLITRWAGVSEHEFWGWFEFHNFGSCLKAGLLSAGLINTVSKTYAQEITASGRFGFGMEGVLSKLMIEGRLGGIVNGIDSERWAVKKCLYDGSDGDIKTMLAAKKKAKAKLPAGWESGETPILSLRSRWDRQKGVLEFAHAAERLMEMARLCIVSWGGPGDGEGRAAWEHLTRLGTHHPDRVIFNNHPPLDGPANTPLHYLVSDFFMMPSHYEPCGLGQMECQRFGAVPIVTRTGGLADTVSEVLSDWFPSPNGYVINECSAHSIVSKTTDAVSQFGGPNWMARMRNVMRQQNGWHSRVQNYENLYAAVMR